MLKRQFALILLGLLILAPQAHSYTWVESFYNPVSTDRIVLNLDPSNTSVMFDGFASVPERLDNSFDWPDMVESPYQLEAWGNLMGTLTPFGDRRGLFEINLISASALPVEVHYTYFLGAAIRAEGDYTFTVPAVPTPIGGTAWLLASGLLAVVGIRRRGNKV